MKILTVFTGGTISCFDKGGVLSPDSGSGSLLLERARQAGVKAEFITTQPYLVLSENLTAAHLTALRRCLDAHLSEPLSGVIVTHGTDTLAYTAAYLDFVFGAQPVPIALVSANYPLHNSRSNGLENFLAAVKLIEAGESGVFVPAIRAHPVRRSTAAETSCPTAPMTTRSTACSASPTDGCARAALSAIPTIRSGCGRTCPTAN